MGLNLTNQLGRYHQLAEIGPRQKAIKVGHLIRLYSPIGPNDLLLLESHHTGNMDKRTRQPSTDQPKILFYPILKNSYNLHLFKIFNKLHIFLVNAYISILFCCNFLRKK